MKSRILTIKYLLTLFSLVWLLSACQHKKHITLATNIKDSNWHENGQILAEAMAKYGWDIEVLGGMDNNFMPVQNNLVDMAIVPNSNIHNEDKIQTIMALNIEVLLVLHKTGEDKTYNTMNELIANRKVLLPEKGSEATRIITRIFKMLDLSIDQFSPVYMDPKSIDFSNPEWRTLLDSVDIITYFTELGNKRVKELLNDGWQLFSEAKVENFDNGSLIDAFNYKYPWTFPVLVPRGMFGRKQSNKLNTIGIKSLLVTNEATDPMLIYDFITDFKKALPVISKKRVAFAETRNIKESGLLSFPLHAGAIRYRDRDKPKFAERYAELIALIVTLCFFGSGLIVKYLRTLKQVKKDKIDLYYDKLLAAKNIKELDSIRFKAIEQLQVENLEANNSFIIFLFLYEELRVEFQENLA